MKKATVCAGLLISACCLSTLRINAMNQTSDEFQIEGGLLGLMPDLTNRLLGMLPGPQVRVVVGVCTTSYQYTKRTSSFKMVVAPKSTVRSTEQLVRLCPDNALYENYLKPDAKASIKKTRNFLAHDHNKLAPLLSPLIAFVKTHIAAGGTRTLFYYDDDCPQPRSETLEDIFDQLTMMNNIQTDGDSRIAAMLWSFQGRLELLTSLATNEEMRSLLRGYKTPAQDERTIVTYSED
ncbi:hypothetical protein FACS189472_00200 [Alphaproteobacteria bacterium]|nr:hypothetical protein FACS189472_00200 [Alphaproteobacteria bacterium]